MSFPLFECSNSGGSKLKTHLLAANGDGHGLKVRLPDFTSLLLRKRYAVAELLSFAGNVACVGHSEILRNNFASLTDLLVVVNAWAHWIANQSVTILAWIH